jgi:hypothetical protein
MRENCRIDIDLAIDKSGQVNHVAGAPSSEKYLMLKPGNQGIIVKFNGDKGENESTEASGTAHNQSQANVTGKNAGRGKRSARGED